MLGVASQAKRATSVILVIEPPEGSNYYDSFSKIRKVVVKYNKDEC